MAKNLVKQIVVLILISSPSYAEKEEKKVPWIEKKAEGWVWFEDLNEKKEKEKQKDDQKLAQKKEEKEEEAGEKLASIKKNLEENLARAILDPSIENVENYMKLQFELTRKSEKFANIWNQVLLLYPELDNTVVSPVSQYGLAISKRLEKEKKELELKKLANDHILLFFFDSRCDFSKAFASIVREFCERYNWKSLNVSMDGGSLEGIQSISKKDKVVANFNVKFVPAVMIFNPKTEQAKPVGWGILTFSQLEDNIVQQLNQ